MTDLAERLNKAEINGVILHVGAGQGAQLDSWLATRAKQIFLVEPNAQLADSLTRRAESEPRLTVIASAVADSSGTVPLNIFNFTELSSIREPGDVLNLFPGLRVTERPMVPALAMSDLLAQLPPPDADGDLLVIDAPGAEDIVLKGLADPDSLRRFSRIILQCGTEALYQGGPAAAELSRDLIAQGYAHTPLTSDDPDFVASLFTFDRAAFAQKEALARLQAAEGQTAALQRKLGDLEAEVTLKTSLLDQVRTTLAEMTASAKAQGDYSKKLEAQIAENAASRKEIDAKVEWRGKRIKELGAELEEVRTTMAAAAVQQSARIAALEGDLAARDLALTSGVSATEQLATRAVALQDELESLRAETAAAAEQQAARVAALEADLAAREAALAAGASAAEQLAGHAQGLAAELDSLRAETAAAAEQQAARVAALEADLAAREAALAAGASAAEEQAGRAEALTAELDNLRAEMAAAAEQQAARVATLEADLAARDAALSAGASAAEQQAGHAQALAAELDNLRAETAAAAEQQAARIATLEADLAARDAALSAGANAAEQQAGQAKALAAELDNLRAETAAAAEQQAARVAALEADLAARDAALAAGASAAEQQARRIAALKAELEASLPRARHNEQVEALNKSLAERDANLSTLRAETAAAAKSQSTRIATLEAELAEQQAAVAKGASATEELVAHIATLEAELAEQQAALTTSKSTAEDRAAQITRLKADLAARDEALAKSVDAAGQQTARIAALKAELEASLPRARHNEHVEALKKSLADRDANLSTLRAQTAAAAETQAKRITTLEADLAEQQAAAAKGASAAEEHETHIATLKADLATRDAALSKHSEEAAQQAKRITTLETQLAASISAATHAQQIDSLKTSLAEREAEMKAVHQQETTLSLRMLALRDADLADLRSRYTRLQSDKEEQDQLLQDLTSRLTEAAYYLQDLEREAPGSLLPVAQAAVSKAPAREPGRKSKKRAK
ncbi:hypothetical protein [Pseudotabrizicola sp. 4114]|uniref:hypothetical protein n=1 Tax=Pseudotabrizicola sp. 4114 TaxID=2817731 RepID=UPI0028601C13|nr:chemotaxis protein MotB [Pseudorhodobacter sp. 4114]